jgi:hypothetical protein
MFFMPSCKEVSRLVSESMDRDLRFRQRFSLRMHLLMCSLCSRFRAQIAFLRDAAHAFGKAGERGVPLANVRLSPEARARIKEALQQKGQ